MKSSAVSSLAAEDLFLSTGDPIAHNARASRGLNSERRKRVESNWISYEARYHRY